MVCFSVVLETFELHSDHSDGFILDHLRMFGKGETQIAQARLPALGVKGFESSWGFGPSQVLTNLTALHNLLIKK